MPFLGQLWLPIVISTVLVFALSAASHMVLPWRRNEWGRITEFEALQKALQGLAPGLYAFPAAPDPKEQMKKDWMERWAQGPSGWITLARPGPVSMGKNLALSLLVFLLVAGFDAYLACHALPPAPRFVGVARMVGTIAFMSFAVAPAFHSIWYSRPWRAYVSDVIDALIFGLAMAVVFGALWPR
ncbi:MAG TPA: hypothetical protein VMG32_04375 [Anaeromyxobacteraceae bacterium]|nr:hypothetical protein [Anaeromyxobacteraceae bacterium]